MLQTLQFLTSILACALVACADADNNPPHDGDDLSPDDFMIEISDDTFGLKIREAALLSSAEYYLRFTFSVDSFNQNSDKLCRVKISQNDRTVWLEFHRPDSNNRTFWICREGKTPMKNGLLAYRPKDQYTENLEDPEYLLVVDGKSHMIMKYCTHAKTDPRFSEKMRKPRRSSKMGGAVFVDGEEIFANARQDWFVEKLDFYSKNHVDIKVDTHIRVEEEKLRSGPWPRAQDSE